MRLELRGVGASYAPDDRAVDGVDLTVKESERMVLLGPSGSGKTTTLRLIAGLLTPDEGDILFDDRSVLGVPPERRGAAMVFQQDTLFPFRTVAENVGFGLRLRRVSRRARREQVEAALASVHLTGLAERWPDELSGGQRRRVALARALVIRPRVLLLDEPLSSLEPALREELDQLICEIQRDEGITTVLVTHEQREAAAVGDRIAVMIGGRIRQVGSPRELYDRPADLEVARFFGAHNVLPGTLQGGVVRTAVGEFAISDATAPDGPVLLTIRPDAIEMAPDDPNALRAIVESSHFVGVAVDCTVTVNGVSLRLLAPATANQPAPGDELRLRVPAGQVAMMPVEQPAWRNDAETERSDETHGAAAVRGWST
ncbi:MAG: ABC transporter ATP-binding protein [Ilumatobacteraceae bacterium]